VIKMRFAHVKKIEFTPIQKDPGATVCMRTMRVISESVVDGQVVTYAQEIEFYSQEDLRIHVDDFNAPTKSDYSTI